MSAFVDLLKRRQKRPLRSLIWLFHPVVLVSLAAHGLFLLIPTSSSSESPASSEVASETSARSVTQSGEMPQADAASALGLTGSAPMPGSATTLPTTPVSPQPKTGTYVASTTEQPAQIFTPSTTPSQPKPQTSSPVRPQTAIAPSTSLTSSTINQRPRSTTPSPSNPSTRSLPQVSPSPTPLRSPAPTLSALPSEAPQPLIDYVLSLQQQYSYQPDQTSEKVVRKAIATWQREIEAESAIALSDLDLNLNLGSTLDLDSYPAIVRESVTMSYPLVACLSHEPHNATVGLVIDESGTLQTEPKLLQGTGYVGLNQRVLERVEQVEFPSTDAPQLYAVDVQVDYSADDCIAAR